MKLKLIKDKKLMGESPSNSPNNSSDEDEDSDEE